jgi:Uncharacterised protein family UPF0047
MVANLLRVVRTFLLLSALFLTVAAFKVNTQKPASHARSPSGCAQKTVSECGVKMYSAVGVYEEIKIPTLLGIYMVDITPQIRKVIAESGIQSGVVTVLSQHTTTAIVINEMEGRLVDDTRQFLLKLVPAACKLQNILYEKQICNIAFLRSVPKNLGSNYVLELFIKALYKKNQYTVEHQWSLCMFVCV